MLPALLEALIVVAAIALLLPGFAKIAEIGAGRDGRFHADAGLALAELPAPVLPELCASHGAAADAWLVEALCGTAAPAPARFEASPGALPGVLVQRSAAVVQGFLRPVQRAELQLARWRLEQERAEERPDEQANRRGAEPVPDASGAADAIAAVEADIQPFIERFQLSPSAAAGPAPLRCAMRWAEAASTEPKAGANAALLLGAALDGRAGLDGVVAAVALPPMPTVAAAGCRTGAAAALVGTAALMADARQSLSNARKNEAMLVLLRSAGEQWAGAMALGFGLLVWSRRERSAGRGVALALAAWGAAAWAARVPWPLTANREFEPARLELAWSSPPAPFVLGLLGLATLAWLVSLRRAPTAAARRQRPQSMSSRLGYAGLVLATGLGALVLIDLSAHGLALNRYLALYHQGHLWLGMLTLSVLLFLRQPLGRALAWMLSVGGEIAHRTARRAGHAGALAALLLLTLGALAVVGLTLGNLRQLTSELGRVWLIVGAAWFFFLRAGPLTDRLARQGAAGASFLRYVWPLLFVIGVLVAAMLVTRDMGPLLIAAYGSGAFLAASLAAWWHRRSGQRAVAFGLAVVLFAAWIGATTAALFSAGSLDGVTATRLESMAAPYASINDQLALVSWFRAAAPAEGFGIGATPWCGFVAADACSGIPAQVHSDYTFTAIVGLFGAMAAWAASIGVAVWLHRLVRHHGRVTRGEPLLLTRGGTLGHDGQALLSWLAVAWVVLTSCQLAVTVAGNLAVLPLTGVTFPFVSFGMTSLLVNMAFLALCLNVDVPGGGRDG
jgi:cell division protein FtsW (lipid II flippase)